jgi:hypothetical protein
MLKYLEWDYDNPKHRRRRRRPPSPLDGEVLEPEPTPRIHRVEIIHHHRRHDVPAWIVPLAIIVLLSLVSPYALIVTIVLIAVFVTMHPMIGIVFGICLTLIIGMAVHERYRGRPF